MVSPGTLGKGGERKHQITVVSDFPGRQIPEGGNGDSYLKSWPLAFGVWKCAVLFL